MNIENIENNLVFCIDPRKAFVIKSIPRSAFRKSSYKNKIRLFSISVQFWFGFLYKTMMKQTVYLDNFARKSGFRLQFLKQSGFLTRHCWRGQMTSPIKTRCYCQNQRQVTLFEFSSLLVATFSPFFCSIFKFFCESSLMTVKCFSYHWNTVECIVQNEWLFNPLPDDKILDWCKLDKFREIADDILKCISNEK